jgi:hypothetical protein
MNLALKKAVGMFTQLENLLPSDLLIPLGYELDDRGFES